MWEFSLDRWFCQEIPGCERGIWDFMASSDSGPTLRELCRRTQFEGP